MSALSSTKVRFCRWAGPALLVVALGCGGSTESPPDGAGASGGSGGTGGTGGAGGSSTGGAGGSSTGGTGGSSTGGAGGSGGEIPDATVPPDSGDVVCNGMVCHGTVLGTTTIPGCCTLQNTCGFRVNIGGQPGTCYDPSTADAGGARPEAGPPGVPDPSCATLMLRGLMLPGCCMSDNTCGFASLLGGCISLEALRKANLPGVNLPEGGPMACQYPPP